MPGNCRSSVPLPGCALLLFPQPFLALAHASPEMAAIWSPEAKVRLEMGDTAPGSRVVLDHLRDRRVTERVLAHAKRADEIGLLLYSATGQANGTDGDQLVIGPPFVIGDAEIERIARGTAAAIRAVREG